jgi:hypothetical protein
MLIIRCFMEELFLPHNRIPWRVSHSATWIIREFLHGTRVSKENQTILTVVGMSSISLPQFHITLKVVDNEKGGGSGSKLL